MTLIAAYRPLGVPVLVGDFLVTVRGGGFEWSGKKLQVLTPNCAVAWTGRMAMASDVLHTLHNTLAGRWVTRRDVENALGTIAPAETRDDLHLIGWIIDSEPLCFRWNAATPSAVSLSPFQVDGSGQEELLRIMSSDKVTAAMGSPRSSADEAIYSALSTATWLYKDEFFGQLNRRKGFGLCYEILYYDEGEFRYVDDIAFLGMDVKWNAEERTYQSHAYPHWTKYTCLGDAAVIRTTHFPSNRLTIDTVLPLVPMDADAELTFTAGSFRSTYYCIFMRLWAVGSEAAAETTLVLKDADPAQASLYAEESGGGFRFRIPATTISAVYERIADEVKHRQRQTIPFGWGSGESLQWIEHTGSRFEFQVGQLDKVAVAGLVSDADWNKDFRALPFALMFTDDDQLLIYENGLVVGPRAVAYTENDVFGLGVEDRDGVNVVCYYRNGDIIYESLEAPELPLRLAAALRDDGARLIKARLEDGTGT
jgi:hypothetical protein